VLVQFAVSSTKPCGFDRVIILEKRVAVHLGFVLRFKFGSCMNPLKPAVPFCVCTLTLLCDGDKGCMLSFCMETLSLDNSPANARQ
jgi:hypothetical protein